MNISVSSEIYTSLKEVQGEMKLPTLQETLNWLIDCHHLNRALKEAFKGSLSATESDRAALGIPKIKSNE